MVSVAPSITKRYDQVIGFAKQEAKLLGKINCWTQNHSKQVLVAHSDKINQIFQDALFLHQKSHKLIGKMSFGSDYQRGVKIQLESLVQSKQTEMLTEVGEADKLLIKVAATLDYLAHASGDVKLKFNFHPSTPWFYERWADNVATTFSTVTKPVKEIAKFVIHHPHAAVAGLAGITAVASLALCSPDSMPGRISYLMAENQTCSASTMVLGGTAALTAVAAGVMGMRESSLNAAKTMKNGLEYTYNNPGKALLGSAKVIICDLPKETLNLTKEGLKTTYKAAEYGDMIGSIAALTAYAFGADASTVLTLAGAGLALKGLHASTGPTPVVLN